MHQRLTYAQFIIGQEEPEEGPNEVAYRLSQLLGHEHYLIHRALVNVNPELVSVGLDWCLSVEALGSVGNEIGTLLLAELMV
jgi:hypothetical protein